MMMNWHRCYQRAAQQAYAGDLYLTLRASFDESKFVRDEEGQFAEKGGGSTGGDIFSLHSDAGKLARELVNTKDKKKLDAKVKEIEKRISEYDSLKGKDLDRAFESTFGFKPKSLSREKKIWALKKSITDRIASASKDTI